MRMKHLLLIVVSIAGVACSHSLSGQSFNGGLEAGVTASQVDGDLQAGFNKFGLNAGLFVEQRFNRTWGGSLGFKYIQKGSHKAADVENGDELEFTIQLDYVEIPLLAHIYINEQMYFDAGISAGVLVRQKNEDAYGELTFYQNKSPYRNWEAASIIGFNYRMGQAWSMGGRYQYSLFSVVEPLNETSLNYYDFMYTNKFMFNNVVQLYLQYRFGDDPYFR